MVFVGFLIALAGVMLMVIGFRGRRIEPVLLCRSCRFDVGATLRSGRTCPECGAKLDAAWGVVRLVRRARRQMIAIGVCTFVFGGALLFSATPSGVGWRRHVPTIVLLGEVRLGATSNALHEAAKRIDNGSLSTAQTTWLVDRALARQADARWWLPAWGDVVEAAHRSGVVSPEQFADYAEGAARPQARLADRVQVGQVPTLRYEPFGSDWAKARVGDGGIVNLNMRLMSVTIDGEPLALRSLPVKPFSNGLGRVEFVTRQHDGGNSLGEDGNLLRTELANVLPPFDLDLGEHQVDLVFEMRAFDGGAVAHSWMHEESTTIRVISPGEPLVDLVTDPQLRGRMERAVRIRELSVSSRSGSPSYSCSVGIDANLPVPIAFTMFIVIDGVEHPLRTVTRASGVGRLHSGSASGLSLPSFPTSSTVRVILRPNDELASAIGYDRIWGEEIVLEDVEIDDSRVKDRR